VHAIRQIAGNVYRMTSSAISSGSGALATRLRVRRGSAFPKDSAERSDRECYLFSPESSLANFTISTSRTSQAATSTTGLCYPSEAAALARAVRRRGAKAPATAIGLPLMDRTTTKCENVGPNSCLACSLIAKA
jgi:hypothetical protein